MVLHTKGYMTAPLSLKIQQIPYDEIRPTTAQSFYGPA